MPLPGPSVGIPRPNVIQLAEFERNKRERQTAWLFRRFSAAFGMMPAEVQGAYLHAIRQTEEPPEVVFGRACASMSASSFSRMLKFAFEYAAANMTPDQIRAEAEFDPVLGWGLDATRARLRDTRPTELSLWMQFAGAVGLIAEGVIDIYSAMGRAFEQAVDSVARTAGRATGSVFSGALDAVKPLLPWALGAYVVYELFKSPNASRA